MVNHGAQKQKCSKITLIFFKLLFREQMKYPAQSQRENLVIFVRSTNAWVKMQRILK